MKNSEKIILHLCADLGSDSEPYEKAGYDVRLIGKKIGVENYHPPKNVYGIIANPVCTEFSTIRGFHKENKTPSQDILNHCIRIIKEANPVWWVIENPFNGTMKKILGKPDFVYQPWEFGSPWTKKTALWGKFNKPEKTYNNWGNVKKNDKLYIRPGRKKCSLAFLHKSAIYHIEEFKPFIDKVDSDNAFRSLCSQCFAESFFEANI